MKEIPLTQGKAALVDDEDFDYINQWKWHFHRTGYAARGYNKKYMHRVILERYNFNLGQRYINEIDHINHNGLDNRKSNLRLATISQNQQNSQIKRNNKSGYKGVVFRKDANKWRAQIGFNEKTFCLGYFNNPKSAAQSYNKKAKELFGQFARTT